jgi:drug/metabolite transporter (DMT)-like permease
VKFSTAPAAVTAAWRLLWTVALMTPVVWGRGAVRQELLGVKWPLALLSALSGLFLAIHFVFWFESLNRTSVASSTTIVCTEVIWVCLGWWLFMGGRIPGKALAAIGVTVVGSVVIAFADSGSRGHLSGDILALLAAVAVAGYTLIGRAVRSDTSTTVYTYLVYTVCALVLVLTCAFQGQALLGHGSSPIWVGLALAVFSTILGHSIFSWCLKYFSPAFVSASKLCEPVGAAALAALIFGQIPSAMQLLGGALILGGLVWYSRMEGEAA